MPKPLVLRAQNIFKTYSMKSHNDTAVLKGLSLEVERGEFLALVGASGVGKSTLLHILGSLDTADTGAVELYADGKTFKYSELSGEKVAHVRNCYLSFIFQFHHLLPEFDALENVMMPALIAGVSFKDAAPRAKELLEKVGLGHRHDHKPAELSGGEQQRIAIARALVNKPLVVLADEPTGNLDSANANSVLELLKDLRREYNVTFVVATHSADVAASADRVITMKDGKIV